MKTVKTNTKICDQVTQVDVISDRSAVTSLALCNTIKRVCSVGARVFIFITPTAEYNASERNNILEHYAMTQIPFRKVKFSKT